MTRDLTGFEVRNYPKTEALQEQKVLSMGPEEQWWFEKLMDGQLDHAGWTSEMPKQDLQNDYLRYAERQKIMRRVTPTGMGKFLHRILPLHWPKAYQKFHDVSYLDNYGHEQHRRQRVWFYEFPSLEAARAHWDERFGGPYQWPEITEGPAELQQDPF